MKHFTPRIRMLLIALMAVTAIQARIIRTTIDNIEYSLNTDTKTAAVTNAYGSWLHTLNIPEKITYQQAEFTVTEIAGSAFQNKTSLTNITLPATLTKIGEGAFSRCTSLTHIFCYMETPVALNADGFYWEKEPYADCTIHVIPGKAEAYRQAAVWNQFQNIEGNIDAVRIETIENIPYFLDGNKKTAAVMKRDFYYGGHIIIPDEVTCDGVKYTVTAIEHGAFYSGANGNPITGITLPKGLKKIGQYALYGIGSNPIYCYPETPAEVYENSFGSAEFSNVLHVRPGTGDAYRNADVWKNFANIEEDFTGNTTADINGNVYLLSDDPQRTATMIFCRNKSGNIRVPDHVSYNGAEYTVTGIGEKVFHYNYELTGITLPEKLKSIGDNAFYGCSKLTAVTLPSGLTDIGEYAFAYCYELTGITLPENLKSIGHRAFYSCRELTAVTLPSGLTDIGEYAFAYCFGLTDVTLSEGITTLGYGMFYGCDKLTNITLPQSLESIGSRAFQFTELTHIILPRNLSEIGGYAFAGCSRLTDIQVSPQNTNYASVDGVLFSADHTTLVVYPGGKEGTTYTVPENVTEVQYTAFCFCQKLTRITLPQGITGIQWGTFSGCTELKDINIPQEVSVIDVYAFESCGKLTHITLPQNICFIGEYAFYGCNGLTDIYSCIDNPQNVEFSNWDGTNISPWNEEIQASCTLHVKPGTGDAYRNAEIWKDFANIADDLTTGIGNMETNNSCIELNGNKLTLGEAAWTVSTLDGRVVTQGTGKKTLNLSAGIYVVRCGNTVEKFHIR